MKRHTLAVNPKPNRFTWWQIPWLDLTELKGKRKNKSKEILRNRYVCIFKPK